MRVTPCALTLDMSGDWKRAKHAGRRPLDGRVRRLMEHGLLASHERQFATPDLRATWCFELNEPTNDQRTPSATTLQRPEAGQARAAGSCRSWRANNATRCPCAQPSEPSQCLNRATLNHNLAASSRRTSTAPNTTPAKPVMSATTNHLQANRGDPPLAAGRAARSAGGEPPRW